MLPTSVTTSDSEPWKRSLPNGLEAPETQTMGLAIDSELEVFKAWSLV